MILTDENYYSIEANKEYMSCSQYQGFNDCEAKELAKLQGRWVDKPSEAFLVGNFFHSYFESEDAHKKFCLDNLGEIYSKTSIKAYEKLAESNESLKAIGQEPEQDAFEKLELKAPFEKALVMIATLKKDPLMQTFLQMQGENEIFMTGKIFGTKWRMKMDKYIPSTRFIVDYKTVANIWETSYNPVKQERQTFVEMYGYTFRAAVYSLIEAENILNLTFDEAYEQLNNDELDLANFFLLCVSKQEHPDKEVIRLNHKQEYIYQLEQIKAKLYRYNMIKDGRLLPKRCGTCDYCRATKVLKSVIPYYELMPELRTEKEDDYNAVEGLVKA